MNQGHQLVGGVIFKESGSLIVSVESSGEGNQPFGPWMLVPRDSRKQKL